MNISFKGFYNTGIGVDINKQAHAILSNNTLYVRPPYVHLSLTTTLNNNGVNDKEIFGEILKKFPNKYQKDTINFHYDKYFSPYQKKYKQEFWLNDRPLILRDENLRDAPNIIRAKTVVPDDTFETIVCKNAGAGSLSKLYATPITAPCISGFLSMFLNITFGDGFSPLNVSRTITAKTL